MVGRRRDQVVEERAGVAPVPPCSSAPVGVQLRVIPAFATACGG